MDSAAPFELTKPFGDSLQEIASDGPRLLGFAGLAGLRTPQNANTRTISLKKAARFNVLPSAFRPDAIADANYSQNWRGKSSMNGYCQIEHVRSDSDIGSPTPSLEGLQDKAG